MENEYISHSGVEGMRWYNRQYQYPDGTYTELGKARRRVGNSGREDRGHVSLEERNRRREAYYDKKEAIRDGDIMYASKHLSDFSNDDLEAIVDRYYKNKKISEIVAEIENKDKLTMEKVAKKLGVISDIAGSSANIAKSVDTMHRSFTNISNRKKDPNYDKKKEKEDSSKKKKGFKFNKKHD